MASNESAKPETTNDTSNENARRQAINSTTGFQENNQEPPRQSSKKRKSGVEKKPQRGMGVERLEYCRLQAEAESVYNRNQMRPPLPPRPRDMQQGGLAGYTGYSFQQTSKIPSRFYPVGYSSVQSKNPVELSPMPKQPCGSHGYYSSKLPVVDNKEKNGGSSESREYKFFPDKRDNSSTSSNALLADVSALKAPPEDTATAGDDQDSTTIDLSLKL